MNLICEPKEVIAEFVAEKIGITPDFGNFNAIAWVDDKGIKVGVIYNHFGYNDRGGYQDCAMHVAARGGAKWATKDFLHHAFAYPFVQLGCRRVTGMVNKKHKKTRKFDEHLGFEFEACIKQSLPGNDDLIIYRMFAEDCRWLKMKDTKLDPNDLIPLHNAWDDKRINQLSASMKQAGWTGRPILVLNTDNRHYAITGTHRIAAARKAGITVPVHFIDTSKTTNALFATMLRAAGDNESAFLVETEMYESGAA